MAKKERPTSLPGTTVKIKTDCGTLFITINAEEGRPFEVLGRLGKSGGCVASHIEGMGRLISTALQHDVPVEDLIKQLRGIRCPQPSENGTGKVWSCADAFAHAMADFMNIENNDDHVPKCPKCGSKLQKKGNTLVCEMGDFERSD